MISRLTITIAAALASGLVVVVTAIGSPFHTTPARHPTAAARAARLAKANRQLGQQLHATQTELAAEQSTVSSLQATNATQSTQIATLQSQVATLAGQLAAANAHAATLSQQLSTAQAQAASLQARLAAIPTPLAVAEEQVQREVVYQEKKNALPFSDGRLISQAAMDYVVGHVTVSAYGYLQLYGLPLPSSDPNSILSVEAGICGHAAATFAAIVKHFGYPVRSAQFWYTQPNGPAGPAAPSTHIADEVYYDGGWHFFDPTFGVYWTDADGNVLDITTVRASGGTQVKDEASFTNLEENYYFGDATAFETDPATTVVLDGTTFGT